MLSLLLLLTGVWMTMMYYTVVASCWSPRMKLSCTPLVVVIPTSQSRWKKSNLWQKKRRKHSLKSTVLYGSLVLKINVCVGVYRIFAHIPRGLCTFLHAIRGCAGYARVRAIQNHFYTILCTMSALESLNTTLITVSQYYFINAVHYRQRRATD